MGLTDRHAPEDTAIPRTGLTESLDVRGAGRFYPEEFTGQIQAVQQKDRILSEIPKSLAGIIESYDDYKISSWKNDEDVAINKETAEAKNRIQNYENALRLDASIEIYDTNKDMQSQLISAMEQADITGTKREDAALEVLEDFKNPTQFEGRPALQQLWASNYQRNSLETLSKAQSFDIETIHAKRSAALQDLIYTGYGEIIAGRENPEQSMMRMMPQITELTKDIPDTAVQNYMDTAWNQLVLAKAQSIVEQVSSGNINSEAGMNALRSLARDYTQKEFTCLDKNGKPILNSDGSQKTLILTLTSETQNQLYRVFKDTQSGGSGKSDELLIDYMKGFDERVGWEQFEKSGTSDKLLNMSPEELRSFMKEQFNFVYSSSASAKTKETTVTDMLKKYSQLEVFMNVANAIKGGNVNIKQFLNNAVNQLENDLKTFNGDWENYTLKVGGTQIGVAGIHNIFPQLGSVQNASAIYWSEALPQLKKLKDLIANGSDGDVFAKIDIDYNQGATNLVNFVSASELTKGKDYSTSINQEGLIKLKAAITACDKSLQQKGYGYTVLPTGTIENIAKNLNDPVIFSNNIQRFMGTKAVVQAFQESGHITDLMNYAAKHSGQDEIGADFTFALCLNQGNANQKLASDMTNLVMKLNDTIEQKLQQEIPNYLKNRSALENEVFDKLGIPQSNRGWYSEVSKYCAYLVADKGGKFLNATNFKQYFEAMIKPNYIKMNSLFGADKYNTTKLNGAIFRYSPQMRNFQDEAGMQRLKNILNETNKNIGQQMEQAGLKSDWANTEWYSDDANGVFRLVKNGRGFGLYGGSFLGTLHYSDNLKDSSASSIGAINALAFTIPMLAINKVARDSAMKNARVTVLKTDKGIIGGGLRDNLHSIVGPNTRTLGQVYYNQDHNFRKDLVTLSTALTNPQKFEKMIHNIDSSRKQAGGIQSQNFIPNNLILRSILNIQNLQTDGVSQVLGINTVQSQIAAPLATGRVVEKGLTTGYASEIDYSQIAAILGETDSATKVNQNDISIPISYAAVGNEGYIDIYNVTQAAGFNISGAPYPSVVMAEGRPTGFAVSTSDMFSGDQYTRPATTTRLYSPEEVSNLVNHYANVFGIPIQLAKAVVNQESGGKQYAKSYKGATGIMQLMPATAKALGVADITDAAQNIWGGMKYLAQQYKQFGYWEYALAAYNAGPGAVGRAKGIPNIAETKNYVRNIMAKAGMTWNASSYPVNFNLDDNINKRRYIDSDTNMLSLKGLNDFIYLINNASGYKNKVEQIKTNRPELLENKKEYADYKKYRDMKLPNGKPLFVKGTANGFQVMVKKDTGVNGKLNPLATEAIADDAFSHQTDALGKATSESIQALVSTFEKRYNNKPTYNSLATFGLANLTPQEYEEYGVPLATQQNPIMQARVLATEFQRAMDVLGSERKAIYALAGGSLKDADGNIKSWAEVKKDKDNFTKQWFIQPSDNDSERNAINTLVATYNSEYNRLRGIV